MLTEYKQLLKDYQVLLIPLRRNKKTRIKFYSEVKYRINSLRRKIDYLESMEHVK